MTAAGHAEGGRRPSAVEVNVDGLVGPTHNYAGLSAGNLASMTNRGRVSSPRRAARQGLAKMRRLLDLGLTQAVLPPQRRPDRAAMASLGFDGPDGPARLAAEAPELVPLLWSASPMWAANAATVSPSADTADGRVHLTPANLWSTPHRSLEATTTEHILRQVFADPDRFVVHPPLASIEPLADEGAANHGRLAAAHGEPGVELFVHGRGPDGEAAVDGVPRRQTLAACAAIARNHGLDPARVIHARQASRAIDAGAFHNDVVAVTNGRMLFTHADAFEDHSTVEAAVVAAGGRVVTVSEDQVPLADAIASYLFNSQLVTMVDGSMTLVAPLEVSETVSTDRYLRAAVADPDHPIAEVHTLDLRESMRNGGGPACLRLRVVLTPDELAALDGRVVADVALLDELEAWVDRHYREELHPDDLADPALIDEVDRALGELATILELPGLYDH
ncbi:MAG: N-succinylarginine dihydrolase [Actinomycetota bacterium]